MCKGLIGKKMGMMGIFSSDGRYIPVTAVQAGPCVVTQIKTNKSDGYNALQLGYGYKKTSRVRKPLAGHLAKSGKTGVSVLREFEVDNPNTYSMGQTVNATLFEIGEKVDVTGTTKGRGFSGVIRRHGFRGGKKTHGSMCHRIPGSIGASAWPSRVIKGKKLPGHYGFDRMTVRNLEIVDIRPDENIVLIKGALPGYRSGIVEIKKRKASK